MWVMDDIAQVFLSCESNSIIYKLTLDKMTEIAKRHKEMEEKFLKFQKKLFNDPKNFPLDYIMNLLPESRNKALSKEKQERLWELMTMQKNMAMRRVIEIKREKAKPGIKQAIQISLKQKAERDEKIRKKLKKKIMEMYEEQMSGHLQKDEKMFTRVIL